MSRPFKRKLEITDREAWLLAVSIRAFKIADARLFSGDFVRVLRYLRDRFAPGQTI